MIQTEEKCHTISTLKVSPFALILLIVTTKSDLCRAIF